MANLLKVSKPGDYSEYVGHKSVHPLVSVIDYSELPPVRHCLCSYDVFGLFLRDDAVVDLTYGLGKYDYREGTLICVAPGQIGGKEDNGELVGIKGWALLFHSDLLRGTPLEHTINEYSFFDYRVNEALHMSDEEHGILVALMRQVREEISGNRRDAVQDAIIVGYRHGKATVARPSHRTVLCRQTLHVSQLLR